MQIAINTDLRSNVRGLVVHFIYVCASMTMLLIAIGCAQNNHEVAKREATDRWSAVRGRLKYELATEQFNVGNLDEALTHVKEAIGLNPENHEPYLLLARIQLERGETAVAVETLNEAEAIGAEGPEMDYLRGVIAERYRRFEKALKWYRSASEQDDLNAHYVAATAEVLMQLDRPADALELVQSRWTDFEQNVTLRALAGAIHSLLGEYEQSASAYRQAHSIAPEDATISFALGRALSLARRYEEALKILTEAQQTADFTPVQVTLLIGQCQAGLKRYADAKTTFQSVVSEHPDSVPGWIGLAQAAVASDDLMTARRAALRAVHAEPENAAHAMMLGFVCYRQQDYIAATESLQRVLDAQPNDPVALCLLGQSREGLGETEQAKQCYQRALKSDAECRWARQLLARVDTTENVRSP